MHGKAYNTSIESTSQKQASSSLQWEEGVFVQTRNEIPPYKFRIRASTYMVGCISIFQHCPEKPFSVRFHSFYSLCSKSVTERTGAQLAILDLSSNDIMFREFVSIDGVLKGKVPRRLSVQERAYSVQNVAGNLSRESKLSRGLVEFRWPSGLGNSGGYIVPSLVPSSGHHKYRRHRRFTHVGNHDAVKKTPHGKASVRSSSSRQRLRSNNVENYSKNTLASAST